MKVEALKEVIRGLINEVSVPMPPNPVASPSKTAGGSILQSALKSLKDNEALRSEIKAEMEANPQDATLKLSLQHISAAILANKEVIQTLSKSGGVPGGKPVGVVEEEPSFEQLQKQHMDDHYVQELMVTIENDGDVSDPAQRAGNPAGRKYEAIFQNLVKKAKRGQYDPMRAVVGWMYFVDLYAAMYAKQFDMVPSGMKWISKKGRIAVAKSIEERERPKIMQAAGVEGQPESVVEEGQGFKYNTVDEFLSDYAMGGRFDPKDVAPEVRDFCKKHNFDIPKMIAAAKAMKSSGVEEQTYAAPSIATECNDDSLYEDLTGAQDADTPFEEMTVPPEQIKGNSSALKEMLLQMLGRLTSANPEISWGTNQEGTAVVVACAGKWLGSLSRENGRWVIKYSNGGQNLKYLVKKLSEVEKWFNDEAVSSKGKLSLEEQQAVLPTTIQTETGGGWDDGELEDRIRQALGWVSNDDPNAVMGFNSWIRREIREAEGRGGVMDPSQFEEFADEFIRDMTDANEEYAMMDPVDQDRSGMTRVEAYPFQKQDRTKLGQAIVRVISSRE